LPDIDSHPVTVLLLDDHPLLRKGVSYLIETLDSEIEVVQSGTLSECCELIELYNPTMIIADLNLPDSKGINSLKVLSSITTAPILIYSLKPEELVGPSCYKHGAKAYVMKDASSKNLEAAILTVLDGGTWCSPTLAAKLMTGSSEHGTSCIENLSKRELEIFESIGDGRSIKEIAFELNLSPKTIESHRDRIKAKLTLANSTELTLKAREWLVG